MGERDRTGSSPADPRVLGGQLASSASCAASELVSRSVGTMREVSLVPVDVNRLAVRATNHCLTGCGIGEVLGMVLATWWGWGDAASVALAIALAFFFGYLLTLVPLLRAGTALGAAVGIALVADTLSITTMEVVDNAVLLLWPGAMDAGLGDLLFWGSLAIALAVAFCAAYPVNRWLIGRGKGHALVHGHH